MQNNKKHFVYQTTNTSNGKIYVGVHYGLLDDGYLGSGTVLKQAIEKYGEESFTRKVLSVFPNRDEAFLCESRIVNRKFVKRADTYNLVVGGRGTGAGEDHPNWKGGAKVPISKIIDKVSKGAAILGAVGIGAALISSFLED